MTLKEKASLNLKRIGYFLSGAARSLFTESQYDIKPGYHHRKQVAQADDAINTEQWQREVYELAEKWFFRSGSKRVIDLGCGSGYNLRKFFPYTERVGMEVEPKLSWLKKMYPKDKWESLEYLKTENFEDALLICSNFIEHVPNPDELMLQLLKTDVRMLIFSTPDRDLVHQGFPYGYPMNQCHYREWNFDEFKKYISRYFKVVEHSITNHAQGTQVIVCEPYALMQVKASEVKEAKTQELISS